MTSSLSHPNFHQHHDFEFPLTDGVVDLEQISTADLTRIVSIFLRALAERRVSEQ